MPTRTVNTKFFTFNQNNSGGRFHEDDRVCHYVIIEATNADDANRRAEQVGLYFDGRGDCSCCGNRWSSAWSDSEGTEEPSIYGKPPTDYDYHRWNLTEAGKVQCRVYYMDGHKEEYR
jgi:hypothetical protein